MIKIEIIDQEDMELLLDLIELLSEGARPRDSHD